MASIINVLGSTTVHAMSQISNGRYRDIAVDVTGSQPTGSLAFINLTLVATAYEPTTNVLLAHGSSLAHAKAILAGSYSDSSALTAVSVGNVGQANGSVGDVVIAALVQADRLA